MSVQYNLSVWYVCWYIHLSDKRICLSFSVPVILSICPVYLSLCIVCLCVYLEFLSIRIMSVCLSLSGVRLSGTCTQFSGHTRNHPLLIVKFKVFNVPSVAWNCSILPQQETVLCRDEYQSHAADTFVILSWDGSGPDVRARVRESSPACARGY